MRWARMLTMLDMHAEGEIGRVVTGGVTPPPGDSMLARMRHVNEVDDSLRRLLVLEPRGSANTTVNVLLPPCDPRADAAFLILQPDRAHAMSGSNAMCVATALLETGMVAMTEPTTVLRLDTPAGLVTAEATCRGGRCESVALDMPSSFAADLDVALDVDLLGRVRLDLAFGGVFYALVDAASLGLAVEPAQARALVEAGGRIHRAVARALRVAHPQIEGLDHVSYVMFCDRAADGTLRGATIMHPGRCDRSPCGTGSAARLAVMHARGEAAVGTMLMARSIIGSTFQVGITGLARVGDLPAILPRISGRAFLFGVRQVGLDPADPWPQGFTVSDLWPDVAS